MLHPLYDNIGVNYDATRRGGPVLDRAAGTPRGAAKWSALPDIACGTGNYTIELASRGGNWHGIDLSSGMLRSARLKGGYLPLFRGDAADLPFRDGSFDGVVCTMALHHLPDLMPVFCETHRVLRQAGWSSSPAPASKLANYWLNEYFPIAMERSANPDALCGLGDERIERIGLYRGQCGELLRPADLQDLFLYAGKHRPELYLSDTVRQGISTFSTLADQAELEEGCARLQRDIESGFIRQVAEKYRNDGGDYVFIVASKPG